MKKFYFIIMFFLIGIGATAKPYMPSEHSNSWKVAGNKGSDRYNRENSQELLFQNNDVFHPKEYYKHRHKQYYTHQRKEHYKYLQREYYRHRHEQRLNNQNDSIHGVEDTSAGCYYPQKNCLPF